VIRNAKSGRGTNRCKWPANVTEVGRARDTDAVERHHGNFVKDGLSNEQPVQCLAKFRHRHIHRS